MTNYNDPAEVWALADAALARGDKQTAIDVINRLGETRPGDADRLRARKRRLLSKMQTEATS